MPRVAQVVFALVIAVALLLWLWNSSASAPPTGDPSAGDPDVKAAAGSFGTAEHASATLEASDRTAAGPTIDAPTFVVEGMVLGDPQHPDLSGIRIVAYRGEVTDTGNAFMSGLDAQVSAPSFILQGEPIASCQADTLGNFVLRAPTPDLRLTIEHDLYLMPLPEIVHVSQETRTGHAVLAPVLGACIRGRLFGERAFDIDGVHLNAEPDPMTMMRDPRLFIGAMMNNREQAKPGEDRTFVFRGVIPGSSFTLTARGKNAFGHMPQSALLPGETREVALTVYSAATLEVTVVDPKGSPISDASVSVQATDIPDSMFPQLHARRSQTQENGTSTVAGLRPTQVHVEAMAKGFVAAKATVNLRAAPDDNTVRLTLGEGGAVTGRVFSADGKPVASAHIAHHPEVDIPLMGDLAKQLGPSYLAKIATTGTETDAEGRFRLTGLADDGDFLVVAAHSDFGASYAKGVRMGDRDVEVTLLDLGAITGRVVTAEDKSPIGKFTIQVMKTMFLVMHAPVHTEVVTSPDGTFRLTGIPPGSYTAQISADGRSNASHDLSFEVSGTDLGTIELARGSTIRGVVMDGDGRPVRGALVRQRKGPLAENPIMALMGGDTLSVRTDPEGRYELGPLPPRRLQLLASAEGFASGRSERVRLDAGQELTGIDITLGHGGTIVGRLLPGPGDTVADFMLMAQEQRTQTSTIAILQPDGAFEIENLDPGIYVVQAMPNGIFSSFGGNDFKPGQGIDFGEMFQRITDSVVSQRCTVRAGEISEVELDAGDLIIGTRWTVRVEIDGKPMGNGIVEAIAVEGGRMRAAIFSNGTAILGNVEPGTYTLRIRSGMTMAPVGSPQIEDFPAGKDEHTTTVSLPGGELRGRVVDAESGEPLHAALVRLIHEDKAAERDDAIGMALTDGDGRFVFPGLDDGLYGVVAAERMTERDGAASQRRIQVTAGVASDPIELRTQAAATASVFITNESGAPVAGATALCVDAEGRPLGALGIATTDPSGRAWFGGMPRGQARVVARAPGLSPAASELRQLGPDTPAEFSLILTSGTLTTVHAVDKKGQPLNGATITARYDDGPWLPAMLLIERTGPGTYELGPLGRGAWEFRVQHPLTGTITQGRNLAGERAITVVLAPE